MLEFRQLELKDKELYDSYAKRHNYRQGESSFANMYMWQKPYDIKISPKEDALFSSMDSKVQCPFILMPFLKDFSQNIAPVMQQYEAFMQERGCKFFMKGVTQDVAKKIREECPDRYRFIYDEFNSEYVYRSSDLIELSGKKYHSKRNHINKFLRDYTPTMEEYSSRYFEECLELQKSWALEKQAGEREAADELQSIVRALENFDYLGLRGCVIKIGGEVAAFSIGEQLSEDTALIHIEKANDRFQGLYAYINREFVANFWSHCEYINREEDMGVPGIRQAKKSYNPVFMVEKYSLELI